MQDSLLLTRIKKDKLQRQKTLDLETVMEYDCSIKITSDKGKSILNLSGHALVFKRYLTIAFYKSNFKKKKQPSPIYILRISSVSLLLKEKKEGKAKKKDNLIYILLNDESIATLVFKKDDDKKRLKRYIKRKVKQLKEIDTEIDLM